MWFLNQYKNDLWHIIFSEFAAINGGNLQEDWAVYAEYQFKNPAGNIKLKSFLQ